MLEEIRSSNKDSGDVYGGPRIRRDLRESGEGCSVHRVARIMRRNGLRARCGYRKPRFRAGKPACLAPNQLAMVVGWSMKASMERELVLDALPMAVRHRRPAQALIIHSDQDSQYGSDDWARFCKAHSISPSMSRRGNCYDNAATESFLSSLKMELVRRTSYPTRENARADLFDYIEVFYNRTRRHSHLGQVGPVAFEKASVGTC